MAITLEAARCIVRNIRSEVASNLDSNLKPINPKLDQELQTKLGKAKRRMLRLINK